MEVGKVIEIVTALHLRLTDIEDISIDYPLCVSTDGDWWQVKLFGYTLINQDDYDEGVDNIEMLIIDEIKEIQTYLNTILPI